MAVMFWVVMGVVPEIVDADPGRPCHSFPRLPLHSLLHDTHKRQSSPNGTVQSHTIAHDDVVHVDMPVLPPASSVCVLRSRWFPCSSSSYTSPGPSR